MSEIFKSIKGYEGYYKISNKGTVISEARTITRRDGYPRRVSEKIIHPSINQNGHKMIVLCKDCKYELRRLEHLLLETFDPNFDLRTDRVVYRDGDSSNVSKANVRKEMMKTRVGGNVTIYGGKYKKPRKFLSLKQVANKHHFDLHSLLKNISEDKHEPKTSMVLKFEFPFIYNNKRIERIHL